MVQAAATLEKTADFKLVPIANITPSKTNPRTHFNQEYLQQLGDSIAEKGIIEPLIVRPLGAKLEIVAGECRYRSAGLAGLSHLPCLVRSLTDEQALEIQIIENLHRKDLTPLEEASGFRALIKTNPDKHSATTIAARIGKSPTWVWDLMKLLDLVPEAKKLLEAGRMTVNHAILIARLKPDEQKRVIDPDDGGLFVGESSLFGDNDDEEDAKDVYADLKPVTVRELQAHIAQHIRFDPHKAAKAAPLLFEEVAQKVDEASAKPGRGKKVISITHNYHVQEDARDPSDRTYSTVSWRRADGTKGTTPDPAHYGKFIDSPKCDYSVLGVVVVGKGYGEAFDVCIARDKCKLHWGKEIAAKAKSQKERLANGHRESLKSDARETAAQKRRREEAEIDNKAQKAALSSIRKAALAKLETLPQKLPKPVFDRLVEILRDETGLRTKKGLTQENLVYTLAIDTAKQDLNDSYWDDQVIAWAEALGVDVKKLQSDAKDSLRLQTSGVKKKAKAA
jgi:ParB family chromosome partitioning protein